MPNVSLTQEVYDLGKAHMVYGDSWSSFIKHLIESNPRNGDEDAIVAD